MKYEKKNNTVVLLGTASTLKDTPWDSTKKDYWACSPVTAYPDAKGHRFDLLFEFHPAEYWMTVKDRLNAEKCPILMQHKMPTITNSIAYPLDKVQMFFGSAAGRSLFTSTISYMLAYAIYLGYERIELYGIHMVAQEEYGEQKHGCEYWIGVANGLGIYVDIPDESSVCRGAYLYGYEQETNFVAQLRIRKKGLEAGIKGLEEKMEQNKCELNRNRGALADVDYLLSRWG